MRSRPLSQLARWGRASLVLTALAAAPAAGQGHEHGHEDGHDHTARGTADEVPLYDDLGSHHHPITTDEPAAQRYFDQGFRLTYAFNHAEAIRSYREAARLDPDCAMCWWGVAWAAGPNINAALDSAGAARAYAAIQKARERLDGVSEKERAYIEAMALRYGPDPLAERARRDSAYARAMARLAERYPDDPDAQVLAGEALMLLSPWDYWTEDGEPKPGAERLLDFLRPVTEKQPEHAGACHFYIHAVEKAHPERAVPCAERIADLMPGAGHVVHMPGHIYIRVGRYADAVEANRHAIHADEGYFQEGSPGKTAYTLAYHPHNFHFLSYAASMAGQSELALESARELAARTDSTMMRRPGFGALQHYLVTPLRVMVRFGLWDEILAEPAPPRDLAYPMATWHYARGMALARSGRLDAAAAELEALRAALADPALKKITVWDLNSTAALMQVAERVLAGELAAARGDYREAIAALEQGIRLETELTYDEPPPWHLPVRHVLGAVLLEAGRPAEAEAVYRKALQRFPENGWALHGLRQSLNAQGQMEKAATVEARLREAWRAADVELVGSRF
ncbi:MAG: tetratricopeptide repeat protein [Gemmatimonadetes bacterium]|uniref:Tetratricopeptide repeat protein n=1 Tax=Candidatus Kutchimonas denitrificans TaxID=3056748 RepID=A0AAE4Z876_9BACT|nr:tetratricopeptide repeat protein [Gemmatimonadota bacterium]NIR75620.1 tetratricopeptide repeat protein [Candidatus Kutchimonas denitrificans]NIS02921.1 tetratricopeptide repeat protein [Gemmatimonadota bacterium]NIT68643.1 tetratricopeptide repeat protein [Gemmatimonadota bacterium]NIV25322.1 tetratricopeptide repeat protein [Gemmatimonadota bacterium]